MLKRVVLMSALFLSLAYSQRNIVMGLDDPIPPCPPACDLR